MPEQVIGPIAYPDVRNLDQGAAEATLSASFLAFTYGDSAYSATVSAGSILTQSPDPDTTSTVNPDPNVTMVTLTVSLGMQTLGLGGGFDFSFGFGFLRGGVSVSHLTKEGGDILTTESGDRLIV